MSEIGARKWPRVFLQRHTLNLAGSRKQHGFSLAQKRNVRVKAWNVTNETAVAGALCYCLQCLCMSL